MEKDTEKRTGEDETPEHSLYNTHGGERAQIYTILRNRDYLLYTLARNIAMIGQQVTTVALGWELYERTHDPMALGFVGLVQFLPVLVLALPAGHAADRFGRKQIVQLSQLILIACTMGLAAVSAFQAPIPLVYLCLLFASIARGIAGPARSAMLPEFVPPDQYEAAIKWNTSMFQLASMCGPALGGAVVAISHSATPAYLLDTVCGIVAFAMTAMAVTRHQAERRPIAKMSLESLTAGMRFVWQTRIILATITLDLFAVLLGGAVALLPVYAKSILHVGPTGLGMMEAAGAAGAFSMAVSLTHLPPMKKAGLTMLWAVGGFGLVTIVFGLSRWFPLTLLALFLLGALDQISVVVRSTLVQVLTPNEMLGRVSAVNNVFISSSNQLGGFESGLMARLIGPVGSVVFGGVGTVLVVALVAASWPEVRKFGSLNRRTT